jgi:hypothetical protein
VIAVRRALPSLHLRRANVVRQVSRWPLVRWAANPARRPAPREPASSAAVANARGSVAEQICTGSVPAVSSGRILDRTRCDRDHRLRLAARLQIEQAAAARECSERDKHVARTEQQHVPAACAAPGSRWEAAGWRLSLLRRYWDRRACPISRLYIIILKRLDEITIVCASGRCAAVSFRAAVI